MGSERKLNAVFNRYRGRMRRLLYEARAYIRAEKVWIDKGETKIRLACSPIMLYDSTGQGEWRMTFIVSRRLTAAEKRKNAGMPAADREPDPDDLDVTFGVLDSEDSDGTPDGMTFSCDFCTIGGSPSGGMTPHNFTKDVWVSLKDAAAIEDRFKIFEDLGGAEMGAAAVAAWQSHHR